MKRTEQIYMFKRKKWWQEWRVRVFENSKASMKSPADISSHFLLPIHYQSIKHFFFSFNICSKVIQISESFFSLSFFLTLISLRKKNLNSLVVTPFKLCNFQTWCGLFIPIKHVDCKLFEFY